jgi:hypothetical protein
MVADLVIRPPGDKKGTEQRTLESKQQELEKQKKSPSIYEPIGQEKRLANECSTRYHGSSRSVKSQLPAPFPISEIS